MSSRTDVDRPAMLVTAIIAVILIAVSAPFTFLWWGEGTTTYEVEWEPAEVLPSATVTVTGSGSQTGNVQVRDNLVAYVHVEFPSCNDTPGLGNNPATVNWALSVRHENGTTETLGGGSYLCGNTPQTYNASRNDQPNLGAREVDSGSADGERDAARAGVWDADLVGSLNETSTYILTASANRPPGQLPGPLAQPSTLNAVLELHVYRWEALLQETGSDEVVR